jgi:hypothetical protein
MIEGGVVVIMLTVGVWTQGAIVVGKGILLQ